MSKRRNIVVGNKTWDRLRELGAKEERSLSELVREALQDLFHKRDKSIRREYNPISDRIEPVQKD